VQKLSQAKNLADFVTIQTEFVKAQDSFNEHAKELGEISAKVATAVTKTRPIGLST
jgi:hypothetical protein